MWDFSGEGLNPVASGSLKWGYGHRPFPEADRLFGFELRFSPPLIVL